MLDEFSSTIRHIFTVSPLLFYPYPMLLAISQDLSFLLE